MKRKTLTILMVMVLALTLCLMPATTASAAATHLVATGPQGTEARIVVGLPPDTTLGDIETIAWEEYLEAGYQLHSILGI